MRIFTFLACAILLASNLFAGEQNSPDMQAVLGPFTHDNLTVFLIQGRDQSGGQKYLTLQEALDQKKVVVHETGNVNELTNIVRDLTTGAPAPNAHSLVVGPWPRELSAVPESGGQMSRFSTAAAPSTAYGLLEGRSATRRTGCSLVAFAIARLALAPGRKQSRRPRGTLGPGRLPHWRSRGC